jgi:hypothetical protein
MTAFNDNDTFSSTGYELPIAKARRSSPSFSPELGLARHGHWTESSSFTWTVGSSGLARIGSVWPVWLAQMFFRNLDMLRTYNGPCNLAC